MTHRGQTSAHGARRAGRFCARGTTNTLNNLNNLSYEDISEEIRYEDDKITKQYKAMNNNNTIVITDDDKHFFESNNKIDQSERAEI